MGRLKATLLNGPATIGEYRGQGMVAIEVRCARPCQRIGRVALETLRLSDDTAFQDIPKIRRLRCSACDRRVGQVSPIIPQPEASRIGEPQHGARWIVVTREANGQEGWSSPQWSREHALRFAKSQIEAGYRVARIEGPSGVIDARDIAAAIGGDDR